jgi:hypothetical protein
VTACALTANQTIRAHQIHLCRYGLGPNVGIKRVADGAAATPGAEADTEAALRRTRRMFINRDNLRAAIRTIVNKTLEARDTGLWGPGTSCASDSRKFGSWSANFMTEWHHAKPIPWGTQTNHLRQRDYRLAPRKGVADAVASRRQTAGS